MKAHAYDRRCRGITLLEVLISLGILSVGLAAVVALVPAGGEQAMKAIIEDRRGSLCSSAMADFVNRGLLDPRRWAPAQTPAVNYRLCFDPIGAGVFMPAGLTQITPIGFATGVMGDEVFRAQDDVAYKMPENDDDPALPLFFAGPIKRLSEGNFSWLATLVPLAATSPFHRLTVVACHRRTASPAASTVFTIVPPSAGQYVTITPSGGFSTDDVKALLPAGTVVFLTDGSTTYEWRKVVMASPTATGGTVSQVEISLDRDAPTGITTVHAVEGAVGMMEKIVDLEGISPWSQ